jgi:hypothetical protein
MAHPVQVHSEDFNSLPHGIYLELDAVGVELAAEIGIGKEQSDVATMWRADRTMTAGRARPASCCAR